MWVHFMNQALTLQNNILLVWSQSIYLSTTPWDTSNDTPKDHYSFYFVHPWPVCNPWSINLFIWFPWLFFSFVWMDGNKKGISIGYHSFEFQWLMHFSPGCCFISGGEKEVRTFDWNRSRDRGSWWTPIWPFYQHTYFNEPNTEKRAGKRGQL